MPKDTFYNLKPEKRNKILAAATEELAENGFANASVNRIVKASGIATGSFYQYFNDIGDVIVYVAIETANKKAKYLQREFDSLEEKTFENLIYALYRGGVRFALEHEKACKIGNHMIQIKGSPLYNEIISNSLQTDAYLWMTPLIQQAIESGKLVDGITPELFFMLLSTINATISEYIMNQSAEKKLTYSEAELNKLTSLGVNILFNGVVKGNGEKHD